MKRDDHARIEMHRVAATRDGEYLFGNELTPPGWFFTFSIGSCDVKETHNPNVNLWNTIRFYLRAVWAWAGSPLFQFCDCCSRHMCSNLFYLSQISPSQP
mmetsp:Transcript_19743/g.37037  ORF Transcript_19743/g.37037 Transcript_19743/m.37037 type:complete len:100 (+) Transcript_19743:202-501(+)